MQERLRALVTAKLIDAKVRVAALAIFHCRPGADPRRPGLPHPSRTMRRSLWLRHRDCNFFAVAITVDDRGLALEVRAPAEGQAMVDSLFLPDA